MEQKWGERSLMFCNDETVTWGNLESRDCIELVDLLTEIFLDKLLKVSVECLWLFFSYKKKWTKKGVPNLLSLKIELFLITDLSGAGKKFSKWKNDFRVEAKSRVPGRSFKTSEII